MSWWAVDQAGDDLATGRQPRPPGAASPAAALAAAPVASWPVTVTDGAQRLGLAQALGPGGGRVEHLLDRLVSNRRGLPSADVVRSALATPAGPADLPVAVLPLASALDAADAVDAAWLARLEHRRAACRWRLHRAGRAGDLEAALHVASLLATEYLDPADDGDVAAHAASGALLWLIAGAVSSALAGDEPDPFGPWAELIAAGLWPVGPSGGRLVLGEGLRLRRGEAA